MIKVQGRSVLVPVNERSVGVEYDNLSETKAFAIPRFYGDLDLYAATPYIKTQHSENQINKYALLPELTDETILLSWTVPLSCMQSQGRLYFQLQFEMPNQSPQNVIVWQSEKSFFTVEKSIPADEQIGSEHQGILQQLCAQVEELSAELENRGLPMGGESGAVIIKLSPKDLDWGWKKQSFSYSFTAEQWQKEINGKYHIIVAASKHGLGELPVIKGIQKNTPLGYQQVAANAELIPNGDVNILAHIPFSGRIILGC